ncbi:YesL family protein [Harryflintia acetispora]|uniref:Membrane protein YesL n=1 Tax=Harryflintia acetispora TaxID=1849041 RepID=A0A9X8UIG0_9FIRM|nr:DUF624 domain-containing protein [Harryflintia acetispora]TCL42971.1 putative membrane protein YesL [Harryflintia acetispora]
MKEGPGVSKDAPEKKRFFLFFELYFRKFWKMIELNLLYVVFFIPAAVGAWMWLVGGANILCTLLVLISLVLYGPATAAMTYVLRNYARQEHAFLFADFKDNFKSNFKQASIYGVFSAVVMILMSVAIWFYLGSAKDNKLMYVPLIIAMATFIIFLFMNFYMYTMIVTFDMKLPAMLKNAFIFAVIGVVPNLVSLLVVGGITVALVLFFPISLLFVIVIALSTMCFVVTFNAYPRIEKHMIIPYMKEHEPEEKSEDEETVFSDERLIPKEEEGK